MSVVRKSLLAALPVKVTAGGRDCHVRSMTLRETMQVEELSKNPERNFEVLKYIVSRCLVNEDGTPVFDDSDADALIDLPLTVLTDLSHEIKRISGMGDAKKIEKNSDATTLQSS